MLADGFGPGVNGPLLVTATLPTHLANANPASDPTSGIARLAAALKTIQGVASASSVAMNQAGDTAILTVAPTTGPQDRRTEGNDGTAYKADRPLLDQDKSRRYALAVANGMQETYGVQSPPSRASLSRRRPRAEAC